MPKVYFHPKGPPLHHPFSSAIGITIQYISICAYILSGHFKKLGYPQIFHILKMDF